MVTHAKWSSPERAISRGLDQRLQAALARAVHPLLQHWRGPVANAEPERDYCFSATDVDVVPVSLFVYITVIFFPSGATVIFDTPITLPSRL